HAAHQRRRSWLRSSAKSAARVLPPCPTGTVLAVSSTAYVVDATAFGSPGICARLCACMNSAGSAPPRGRRAMTDRQITHAPDCWSWGPRHYECALREMELLVA